MLTPSITDIIGPAVEPVTLAEFRNHIIDEDVDAERDAQLSFYLEAARTRVEEMIRSRLMTQTVELAYDAFPRCFEPPIGPIQSVTSITYDDTGGVEQTLAASAYRFTKGRYAAIDPAYGVTWPSTRAQRAAVRLRLVVGYGDAASAVPAPIREAILLLGAEFERFRSDTLYGGLDMLPTNSKALLMPHVRPI